MQRPSRRRKPGHGQRIGLTGGLGSGKSTVVGFFRELGAQVIEADELGRALMEPGQSVFAEIVRVFGQQVVTAEGRLNRPRLADMAFGHDRLNELNAIVHPAVIAAQREWMGSIFAANPNAIAIVESALIFEVERDARARGEGETVLADWRRRIDRIVVVTAAFEEFLVKNWNVPREKISVVENGVETELFAPKAATDLRREGLRRELDLEGKFVVSYIGTMGMAHGLQTIIEAAACLQERNPKIAFLMLGEGADKDRIVALARDRGVNNLRFVDQQPREKIPSYICASDVCLVLLKKTELFKTVLPTKMLEFMSCARPVILGVDGQARTILEDACGGLVIEPENPNALIEAICYLEANRDLARELGRNGREHMLRNFSRQYTAEKYIRVLERVVKLPESQIKEIAA